MGSEISFVQPALNSQNVQMPGGFDPCEQSQIDDLYQNFANELNENVAGMEYCYAQVVEGAINYKISLIVEESGDTYMYDHFNVEEKTGDQYTVMCENTTTKPDQPTQDC